MERIFLVIAAVACLGAAGFSAMTALTLKSVATSEMEAQKKNEALRAMRRFDTEMAAAPRQLACLRVAVQIKDPGMVNALHAGASFELPAPVTVKDIGGCRAKFAGFDASQPIRFSSDDSKGLLKNMVFMLSNFETLFGGVQSGLSDCQTIEARHGKTLEENRDAFFAAIRQIEEQKTALTFPAFAAYLEKGC